MAIVAMSKIKLVGMNAYREDILNTLQKTGCVDLSAAVSADEVCAFKKDENLASNADRVERAVEFLTEQIDKAKNKPYFTDQALGAVQNFFVSYEEFMGIGKREAEILAFADLIKEENEELNTCRANRIKLINLLSQLEPYEAIQAKFSDFKDTRTTKVFFGTVKVENVAQLQAFFADKEYTDFSLVSSGSVAVVLVVAMVGEPAKDAIAKLNECGYSKCLFDFMQTPAQKIKETEEKIKALEIKADEITEKVFGYYSLLKDLKILADYYNFMIEKERESEKFSYTQSTFVLEGYLPTETICKVEQAVKGVTDAVFMEFSQPSEEDEPPTLTNNNKLVHQTEFVTDLYSTPNYREVDPNKAVFFFFMLFMGVIMADIGYGVLMIAIGAYLASKQKVDNGSKKLWNVILIGGVFSIIFGILFNSLFGFAVLPFTILPSPIPEAGGTTHNLMTILLLCLLLGVIQMAVGYFIKALNHFKHGEVLDGILEGLLWVLFFVGFICAVFNFIVDYLMQGLQMNPSLRAFFDKAAMPGLYTVIGTLVIAALTAGRHEKGFGKFSKGFGKIYGLINVMSDILSYARLFGLMLSGMIIAQTFNDMGLGMMAGGGVGYVLGAMVMVIGHVFNIAMGVLGAYIHDSRLQYIEFFNIFYTGEGLKFKPLGSTQKYVYLKK